VEQASDGEGEEMRARETQALEQWDKGNGERQATEEEKSLAVAR
jgi:hypothetical protein